MGYRLSWNRITKSVRLHTTDCRHSLVSIMARTNVWSDPIDDKEEAVAKALQILVDHLECADCLSSHRCGENVFAP